MAYELGVDKTTVSRLLKHARDRHLYDVRMFLPRQKNFELSLIREFNLIDAAVFPVVSPSRLEYDEYRRLFGESAAQYLESAVSPLRSGLRIGLACGSTLRCLVDALSPGRYSDMQISQLAVETETSHAIDGAPFGLVASLYSKWKRGSEAYGVQPLAGTLKTENYRRCRTELEKRARELDMVWLGIGHLHTESDSGTFFEIMDRHGISHRDFAKRGVIGEICNRPFDGSGNDISSSFPSMFDYVDGVSIDTLKTLVQRQSRVTVIAGGKRKANAIRVALREKFVNCIITDLEAAEALCGTRQQFTAG